jgi:predicted kinase
MTATLHLVCGSIGAGKTTYALKMMRELAAVHFSIDDWMVRLFGPDKPLSPGWPWIADRVTRCESLIFDQALQLGRCGVSSILDLAFLRAERRQDVRHLAETANLPVRLHFIDVPAEMRWQRVCSRNETRGDTYRVTVTRPMFDFIETIWQPPTPEEMSAFDGVRGAA